MERFVRKIAVYLFIAMVVPSCELFDDCKTCSLATYIDGEFDSKTPGILYCGKELREKENQGPVVNGNTTQQWECY